MNSAGDAPPLTFWREERIQRGDTIGAVLARLGIEDPEAMHFVRTEPRARSIYQLKPGRAVRAEVDEDGLLQRLRYLTSPAEELYIERSPAGLAAHIGPARAEARMHTRSASITRASPSLRGGARAPALVSQIRRSPHGGTSEGSMERKTSPSGLR